jgi:hypothetical protein
MKLRHIQVVTYTICVCGIYLPIYLTHCCIEIHRKRLKKPLVLQKIQSKGGKAKC